MLPILLHIGPLEVYSYGVTLALAFVAGWGVARWYLPRRGVSGALATDAVLAAVAGGVAGARILHVAGDWNTYAAHPLWIFMLQRGGMVFYGGLVGGGAAVSAYVMLRGLPVAHIADAAALAVPLGSAIGRVGCFMNGCCAGRPTSSWMGVSFPSSSVPLVPAQLIDSTANLLIFVVMLRLATLPRLRPGTMWWLLLTLYPVARFGVEALRVNPTLAMGLTQAQWISVPVFLAGVAGLTWTLTGNRRSGEGREDG